MAKIKFSGEDNGDSNVSKPVKRMRWATQRNPGQSGAKKRLSILNRHKRTASSEESRTAKWSPYAEEGPTEEPAIETQSNKRTIHVNVPLPEKAKDEQRHINQRYARNKIRTSRYTPLSFIPKNLWYQFHNIANIYFFFTIILNVSPRKSYFKKCSS